ncbi:MAG TPA: helix-turn-helix transcriptional regulator [Steroidobacteraceae bacterium]
MSEEDTESPTAGPGPRLTSAREQAGWSVLQAADRLHLDVAAVKALESGHYEALGAVVYARGHLRRYAELLGLPAEEVEAAYLRARPSARPPDLKRKATPLEHAAPRIGALRPGTAAIGAVVLVMVALVWWAMRVPRTPRAAPAAAAHPSAATEGSSAGESGADRAARGASGAGAAAEQTTAAPTPLESATSTAGTTFTAPLSAALDGHPPELHDSGVTGGPAALNVPAPPAGKGAPARSRAASQRH